jgi:bile acid:Na+ symporter, BASS family
MMLVLKISLVIFMAGNLLDMGLRLNPQDALRGLKNARFVVLTLLWGFVLAPAVAYGITRVIPLEAPYAMGLILLGMTPCAPFLPMIVSKSKGDLGYTAAFMLLAAVGTVIFMPFAVPLMVKGLTVGAWAIAKPLFIMVLIPLAVGMVILRLSPAAATKIQPFVKKITGIATILVLILCLVVYGKGLLGAAGEFAVASQLIFFVIVSLFTYWFGIGLLHQQKVVLSAGMTTRNIGAALAPLLSVATMDQRATVMVVLALPMMVVVSLIAAKMFGRLASKESLR